MSDLARPLADAAERLFAKACSFELVRAPRPTTTSSAPRGGSSSPAKPDLLESRAEQGEWPQALWLALEELGAPRLLLAEDRGGAGGDWLDACALLERAGEFNVPLPIAETLLAAWLLDRAGVAAPTGVLALAIADIDLADAVRGRPINLELPRVPWAARCEHLVIAARQARDVALLCLPRAAFTIRPGQALSGEPRDTVSIADFHLDGVARSGARIETLSFVECQSRAALLHAALIAGACRRVLALTLQYTSERIQFGRAIGQFQAVQHQLAQLAEETAAARVAVHAAAATTDARLGVAANAAAKLRAGEAAGMAVRIAHQLHGALGVTLEHPLQHSTRRLLTWRDEHGAEAWWARELVAQFREGVAGGDGARGASGAWSLIVAATTR